MRRYICHCALLSLLVFMAPGSAISASLTFDFDSGPGPLFSISNTGAIWNIDADGPTMRFQKGEDDRSINPRDFILGAISSKFNLEGDFSITTDFTLHDFPAAEARGQLNESLLGVTFSDGFVFEVLRFRSGDRNRVEAFLFTHRPLRWESKALH